MADELETESAAALLEFKNGRKMKRQEDIKEEVLTEDEEITGSETTPEEELQLGPEALGLQRVGAPTTAKPSQSQPVQVLNARGMPARIRKKNKLFFDDELVNTPHHRVPSAKKLQKDLQKTPVKKPKLQSPLRVKDVDRSGKKKSSRAVSPVPVQSPDRKIGQKIGMRLRNLLKLPKAHKWVCYEWFYSNIDRCLFEGDNDFTICLKESFPELKTRELTRVQWTKIRRMMGRPRRCSQAFFNQERLDLEKKRNKIRALQQRKVTDLSTFQDLPVEIPMQLVIGSKVTARLRKPQDGLFTGSIDAVDTSNNTYRITFERSGLGTHSVPDYEVLSNEPPETMSVNTLQPKPRRNGCTPTFGFSVKSPKNIYLKYKQDSFISPTTGQPNFLNNEKCGGFPTALLKRMVLVKKILSIKRVKIKLLKSMNTEAEKYNSFDEPIPEEFERRYAGILINLEKLNNDLQIYLDEMQTHCHVIAPEPSVAAMLAPSHLRERCHEEGNEIVQRIVHEKPIIRSEDILELITNLTALMLQVKCLSDSDQNAYELQVLEGTMEQIKRKLSPSNQTVFQTNVQVHMKHIQLGLGQANKLK